MRDSLTTDAALDSSGFELSTRRASASVVATALPRLLQHKRSQQVGVAIPHAHTARGRSRAPPTACELKWTAAVGAREHWITVE